MVAGVFPPFGRDLVVVVQPGGLGRGRADRGDRDIESLREPVERSRAGRPDQVPRHGQGVARSIQRQSEEVFFVDHGSLYLALQRLEDKKWVTAKWGVSENNRKARFYTITTKGREQLVDKTNEWQRLTRAMGLILG